jgi:hypothetical protein
VYRVAQKIWWNFFPSALISRINVEQHLRAVGAAEGRLIGHLYFARQRR